MVSFLICLALLIGGYFACGKVQFTRDYTG